jgi:hypothetical protein
MQLSFRRSFLGLSALYLALGPFSGAQAQTRAFPPLRSAQGNVLNRSAMLQGTVAARRDNNEFDLRVGGATFRVRSASNVVVRNGDRVVVRGSFRNNEWFDAQSVRIGGANNTIDDGSNFPPDVINNGNRVDFPGVVTRILSRREIEVRGDNNRLYRVSLLQDSGVLRVGARLRVRGEASGSRIINARLLVQNITGGGYYGGNGNYGGSTNVDPYEDETVGRSVDFPGRVVRIDQLRNEATVRGDNGRDYRVRGAEVDTFRTGDRVRVRGQAVGDFIELDRLDLAL